MSDTKMAPSPERRTAPPPPPSAVAGAPVWLSLLGGAVLVIVGGCLAYAVAIAVLRFSEIGV